MPEEKEIKLYRKFTVIRNSTGITETEEYVCLRLSKKIDLGILKREIGKLENGIYTWKDIELRLLVSEV